MTKLNITQVRNATQIIEYAGKKFLIDPLLAEKGAYPGFEGCVRSEIRNPTVELPIPAEDLIKVDAIIVTHTHADHWDEAAIRLIPKEMTIYVQDRIDEATLRSQGFTNLHVLSEISCFEDVSLIKTGGQHGSDVAYAVDTLAEKLGDACGVIFKHPREKTLYIAGDTIWNDEVENVISTHKPDIVVLNAGFAQVITFGSIIMGKEDILRAHVMLPNAKIVATHMEAINHCILTRKELRDYVEDHKISESVLIPEDGETNSFK